MVIFSFIPYHPTTRPPGKVFFATMKHNLEKQSCETKWADPKTVNRPNLNPKKCPDRAQKGSKQPQNGSELKFDVRTILTNKCCLFVFKRKQSNTKSNFKTSHPPKNTATQVKIDLISNILTCYILMFYIAATFHFKNFKNDVLYVFPSAVLFSYS